MAVYYKFKSARDYDSISMDGPFISVGTLKEKIFESKHFGRGTDFDLVVTHAQTNEEYLDEAMLIPKNSSVLIRRVPGRPRMPIVAEHEPKVDSKAEDTMPEKSNFTGPDSSAMKDTEDNEWDEFGNDLYAIPETLPVQSSIPLCDAPPTNKADEDSKIKALIDTPALDWQRQGADGFGPARGFGRGMAGRMGGRGFGLLERKTPPQGYVCHRCKVPGHFIQNCPTNGDPNYDIKRVKPPTGIPKSMLMATPDGSYALPSGAVAVLRPNEAAFVKEIEGLPSTRSVGDLPPELHCPLCKEVMKNAVLTSKCCFKSFCDECIRNHFISKSKCVCGATDILADDLLPNKTLRDTINRILESGSSAENAASTFQVQDMESARLPQPKIPSPTQSAASKGEQKPFPLDEGSPNGKMKEEVGDNKPVITSQQLPEKVTSTKVADMSEATHGSISVRKPAPQGSAPVAEEKGQQKLATGDAGKKKKTKKVRMPPNDLWKAPHDLAAESYMMPMGPPTYNPYWAGMQPGIDGFMAPYAGPMPFMGYGLGGPLDIPCGGIMPPDPFGAQSFMMPVVPPQRDLTEFGMGMNTGPPAMSREEFEAWKSSVRRRREHERRAEREFSSDRDFAREVRSSGDVSSMKSKPTIPRPSSSNHHHRHQSERSSPEFSAKDLQPLQPRPSSKEKSEHPHRDHYYDHDRDRDGDRTNFHGDDQDHDRSKRDHQLRHYHRHRHSRSESSTKAPGETIAKPTSTTTTAAEYGNQNSSVFSRISFSAAEEPSTTRKRKPSFSANGYYEDHNKSSSVKAGTAGGRKSSSSSAAAAAALDYSSSDDDRHFKRKASRDRDRRHR